jgi:serralysin
MIGGLGNETYVVDSGGDVIVEAAGEGIDTVQSSVSHTLAANVEKLTLTGSAGTDATGNALANTIIGNSGINHIDGGALNDILTGGGGADDFVFGDGDGIDTVTDFQNGADQFDLTGVAGVDEFSDLVLTDLGASVKVDYGTGSFELANVASVATVDAGDFIFA